MKLLNAFSLQMLAEFPASVCFKEIKSCRGYNHPLGDLHLCGLERVTGEMCSECGIHGIPRGVMKLSDLESFIGHRQICDMFGVQFNRSFATLEKGEKFVVLQLIGGRLPEGITDLKDIPDGFSFKFFLGEIL